MHLTSPLHIFATRLAAPNRAERIPDKCQLSKNSHYATLAATIDTVHDIKIEALRRLGELLKVTPKNVGAKGSIVTGSVRAPVKDETPTLADIDKKTSAVAQKLAHLQWLMR
jgi:hypothetical protein